MQAPNFTRKQWVFSHIITVFILFLTLFQVFKITGHGNSVSFLDVGQGDAVLIQTSEFKNILIDTGPDRKVVEELSKKMNFFNKTIDLLIITHPHNDHFVGFFDIINKYKINKVAITGVASSNYLYSEFLKEIKLRDINLFFLDKNHDFQIGNDSFLDNLYPFDNNLIGRKVHNLNNTSIVSQLNVIKDDQLIPVILFTGDAEHEEEREVLLSGQSIDSPILKIGHHGSKTATSNMFLTAVKPQKAIVSVGIDNTFNHPSPETIDKLDSVDVYQTKNDGTLTFNF